MRGVRIMSMLAIFVLMAVGSTAQSNRPSQTFDTSAGPVKVTPLYHASMLIEAGGKDIYVDPAKPANFSGLPKADLILITDIHGDHMDPEAIAAISKPGTQILAPPAVVATVTTAAAISNGETKSWAGWTIEAIPMYNLKRGPAARQALSRQGPRQRLRPHLRRKALLHSRATPKAFPKCARSRISMSPSSA